MNYCSKCEDKMARSEEATMIDGEILCLNCVPMTHEDCWTCNHCQVVHTPEMTIGHQDEHGKTCTACWGDIQLSIKEEEADQFKSWQSTRKKVTRYYDTNDGNDPKETAFVYGDNGGEYICESYHILIWDDEELIKKHGGKYYLILDRGEYNSNDLNELEKLLYEWTRCN